MASASCPVELLLTRNRAISIEDAPPCKLLSVEEAKLILGRNVRVAENTEHYRNDSSRFTCAYTASTTAIPGGSLVTLAYSVEESPTVEKASGSYRKMINTDKDDAGVVELYDVADEAYQLGTVNFHTVVARKGRTTLRLKISPLEQSLAGDALETLAAKFMDRLHGESR